MARLRDAVAQERRARTHRDRTSRYPAHPPGMEDFSKALERPMKPPPGWRRALGSEQLSRGKAGWLATVVPQEPGKYRVVLVRDFDDADEAMSVVDGIVDA